MGVAITDLLIRKEIEVKELENKVLIVDAPMWLYQFLSSIRQRDGSLLTDSKGMVTSHLIGLFSRIPNLMKKGIKLGFVFDGKRPELKKKEVERRKTIKLEAEKRYKEAVKKKNIEEMKKYASRTSRLNPEMIEEAKKLIRAFGLPVIQAPSEGEAQAAYIVKKGKAFAVASNDADSLLFGATKLIRNLSILGKRKKVNKLTYSTIKPEIIELAKNINHLGIEQNQLIALSMLVGTDYNPGGIKGIGPKNALKLVKQFKNDFDELFKHVKWDEHFDFPWTDVYYFIKKVPVTDDYELEWKSPDPDKITKILVEGHDFSEERIEKITGETAKEKKQKSQKGLGEFL
ncbi:flap endonuclease-1 [Candidatus Woesearchaeota archaeon]|nr:flap endonuclease-1 [Candidatus Woesearchaeota archaeon]|tara:strand:- start:11436 stop:12470 length:1035 start_codon:yes stop_codon:yes gene_type:complete